MWFCWDHSNTSDFEHGNSPRNYHILCYCQAQPKQLKRIRIRVHCGFQLPATRKERCWASTHSHLQEYQELKSNQTPQEFETVGSLHFSDLWGCPDHPQSASNFHFHQSVQKTGRSEILCSPEQNRLFQKDFSWFPSQKKTHTSFDGHNYTLCYLINSNSTPCGHVKSNKPGFPALAALALWRCSLQETLPLHEIEKITGRQGVAPCNWYLASLTCTPQPAEAVFTVVLFEAPPVPSTPWSKPSMAKGCATETAAEL